MFYNRYEEDIRQNDYVVPEAEEIFKVIRKVSEAQSADDVSVEELKTVLSHWEYYINEPYSPKYRNGYFEPDTFKIDYFLKKLISSEEPAVKEECFDTFQECFNKSYFEEFVETKTKEYRKKLLRVNHFYATKPLSEIEVGERYKFYIYNISVYGFERADDELVKKFKKSFKGTKSDSYITGSNYKSDKYKYGVVIDKHPANEEFPFDMITVMFKAKLKEEPLFHVVAKCETGFDIPNYSDCIYSIEGDLKYKRVEENKRPLLRQLIKLDKEQFIEYYKLILGYGELFISKEDNENLENEITQLLRADPRLNPKYVNSTDKLFFFNYINYIVIAQILSKHINRRIKVAAKISKELFTNGIEAAKAVPVPFTLFPDIE